MEPISSSCPCNTLGTTNSSFLKMKPVQIPSSSADHRQQPKQYDEGGEKVDCEEDCRRCPRLPAEMILSILSFLDGSALISCSTVSRMWNSCCKDEFLWKTLYECNPDSQVFTRIRSTSWYVSFPHTLLCRYNTYLSSGTIPVYGCCSA